MELDVQRLENSHWSSGEDTATNELQQLHLNDTQRSTVTINELQQEQEALQQDHRDQVHQLMLQADTEKCQLTAQLTSLQQQHQRQSAMAQEAGKDAAEFRIGMSSRIESMEAQHLREVDTLQLELDEAREDADLAQSTMFHEQELASRAAADAEQRCERLQQMVTSQELSEQETNNNPRPLTLTLALSQLASERSRAGQARAQRDAELAEMESRFAAGQAHSAETIRALKEQLAEQQPPDNYLELQEDIAQSNKRGAQSNKRGAQQESSCRVEALQQQLAKSEAVRQQQQERSDRHRVTTSELEAELQHQLLEAESAELEAKQRCAELQSEQQQMQNAADLEMDKMRQHMKDQAELIEQAHTEIKQLHSAWQEAEQQHALAEQQHMLALTEAHQDAEAAKAGLEGCFKQDWELMRADLTSQLNSVVQTGPKANPCQDTGTQTGEQPRDEELLGLWLATERLQAQLKQSEHRLQAEESRVFVAEEERVQLGERLHKQGYELQLRRAMCNVGLLVAGRAEFQARVKNCLLQWVVHAGVQQNIVLCTRLHNFEDQLQQQRINFDEIPYEQESESEMPEQQQAVWSEEQQAAHRHEVAVTQVRMPNTCCDTQS